MIFDVKANDLSREGQVRPLCARRGTTSLGLLHLMHPKLRFIQPKHDTTDGETETGVSACPSERVIL
jgi:hypothetical protein